MGGPSIAAAHECEKVGGPRPARPYSFRRLCLGGTVDAKNILVPRSVTVPDLVTVGLVSEISVEKMQGFRTHKYLTPLLKALLAEICNAISAQKVRMITLSDGYNILTTAFRHTTREYDRHAYSYIHQLCRHVINIIN